MSGFEQVTHLKGTVLMQSGGSRLAIAPRLGGRIYADIAGTRPHRIDAGRRPKDVFGNHGGNTFWPAPEGGR